MQYRNISRIWAVVAACVFAVHGAGAGEPGAEGEAKPAYVTVGKVVETDGVEVKRYTGHVSPMSSVDLVARVSGELLRVGFEEGDTVKEGQVLYELDATRYEAEVRNIEARIAEYEARLSYNQLRHDRAANLYERRADTKEALDSAESELKASRAALLAAEAQLVTVKDDLKNTRIMAPITGKIGITNYTRGNYLTPNSGIVATIVKLDPLRISFALANRDYLSMFGTEENLKEQSLLRLKLADDSDYEFEGRVKFLDNQASQKTDAIRVFAEFDNPAGKLVPGSTVTVLLSRRSGEKRPAVLPSAVMHDSKSAYVYVVGADNKVERRDVVLGFGTRDTQIVEKGLLAGEVVVIDGMHKTMPGATVEPDFRDTALAATVAGAK